MRRVAGSDEQAGAAPSLTRYFERDHDRDLRSAISAAADGPSVFACVTGGSTVGKTRALYEAVCSVTPEWTVVKPQDADELLSWLDAEHIGSGMILWLDETHLYLDGAAGSKAASRLDRLLSAVPRIVAVGALWLDRFDKFAAEGADPAVRRLLESPRFRRVIVPEYLTKRERQAWSELAVQSSGKPDPRVAMALDAAGEEGAVVQHLTRGPELLRAYRSAAVFTAVEQAVVTAALSVRRLGHISPIPAALLEQAAHGYLTDRQRPGARNWIGSVLSGLSTGKRTDGRPVGVGHALPALAAVRAAPEHDPRYLPDDYLDQQTLRDGGDAVAPPEVWGALIVHAADADDLERLGSAASEQGYYRHAGLLWVKAINGGSTGSVQLLVELISRTCPQDIGDVTRWVVEHGALGDPADAADLLDVLRKAGAGTALAYVLGQRPGELAGVESPWLTAKLIRALQDLGEQAAARELADRAAAGTSLGDAADLAALIEAIHRTGATGALARLLAGEPAKHLLLDDGYWLGRLLRALRIAGATPLAVSLAMRIAERAPAMPPEEFTELARMIRALCGWQTARNFIIRMADQVRSVDAQQAVRLLEGLRTADAADAVTRWLDRNPVDQITLDDPAAVADLLVALRRAGAHTAAAALAREAAARPFTGDTSAASTLVDALREAGAADVVARWLDHNPVDQITLDDPEAVADLLVALRRAGAHTAATALSARAAEHLPLHDSQCLPGLLREIRMSRSWPAGRKLAERIAENASLEEAGSAAELIEMLQEIGGGRETVARLLDHNAVDQIMLDDPAAVADLLVALRRAGAHTAATALSARAAEHLPLHDMQDLPGLLREMSWPSSGKLAIRVAETVRLEVSYSAVDLVRALQEVGAADAVGRLLDRNPVDQIKLGEGLWVARLLEEFSQIGAGVEAARLAMRAAGQVRPETAMDAEFLLNALHEIGATEDTARLLDRIPFEHIDLGDAYRAGRLLETLREVAAGKVTARLAARAAGHIHLEDAGDAADFVVALREAGASSAITQLLEQNPVERIRLDDTNSVNRLLEELRNPGTELAVSTFAVHVAEDAEITDPEAVTAIARTLRRVGAVQEAFIFLRRATKANASSKAGYPTILDNFPSIDLNDPSSAYELLRYGPGFEKGPVRRWAWSDISEQEPT